jgi:hypothetical protein
VLPADYTFAAGDSGKRTFSVTLNTTGSQTITATDTVTGSITGKVKVSVTTAPQPLGFAGGSMPDLGALDPNSLDAYFAWNSRRDLGVHIGGRR